MPPVERPVGFHDLEHLGGLHAVAVFEHPPLQVGHELFEHQGGKLGILPECLDKLPVCPRRKGHVAENLGVKRSEPHHDSAEHP